ncbi:hypothetical protein OIU77_021998 [Salix suchowensis]|uniref:Uncharacterized protein n=1 Tax=Salix suchowensis TaxID=1278906 RepID=A0ABQ9CCP8_9ROSI|nr:hypothetical protein OIU77_021998 [Salix suchowensis]
MAIFPTVFLPLLLLTSVLHCATADSDDLVTELLSLQSQSKSGIIHLDDQLISRFLTAAKSPRPYSLLIFFDAEQFHSKPELHLQDLYTQYSLVSSSFIANNDVSAASSLFFCDIEFKESQKSFSLFGVNSLPHIRLVGPNVKNLQDSEVMDQGGFFPDGRINGRVCRIQDQTKCGSHSSTADCVQKPNRFLGCDCLDLGSVFYQKRCD